jgi:hypothetical protein
MNDESETMSWQILRYFLDICPMGLTKSTETSTYVVHLEVEIRTRDTRILNNVNISIVPT